MKRLFSLLFAVAVVSTAAAQTAAVQGMLCMARFQNGATHRWTATKLGVYVDAAGNAYLHVPERTFGARGLVTAEQLPELIAAIEKGKEWAQQAQANKDEVQKELGNFTTETDTHTTGGVVSFLAAHRAAQTDVVFQIRDFENGFQGAEIYVRAANLDPLLALLKKVPETVAGLQAKASKASRYN